MKDIDEKTKQAIRNLDSVLEFLDTLIEIAEDKETDTDNTNSP